MDLSGIPKRAWRARIIEAYVHCSGNTYVPRNEYFFTLGGPCAKKGKLIPNCELDFFTSRSVGDKRFLLPHQYVSVENKRSIYEENVRLDHDFHLYPLGYSTPQDPLWAYGEIESLLETWVEERKNQPIAIVNADFMCGVEAALPKVEAIVETMEVTATPDAGGTLLVFNVIAYNQLHDVKHHRTYSEVRPKFAHFEKKGLKFVDWSQYQSRTVGQGSRSSSLMETLIYWY